MNLTQKVITAGAAATVIALTCAQFAFAANVTVAGNGKKSVNSVTVNSNKNVSVSQNNSTVITNQVVNNQNTGNNKANDNGGDVSINTGGANTSTNITVTGSTNNAVLPSCGCDTDPNNVLVAGNLKKSVNVVTLNNNSNTSVGQNNWSVIGNYVVNNQNTGGNQANDNLGGLWLGLGGDPSINTNGANTSTNITVTGSSNTLH